MKKLTLSQLKIKSFVTNLSDMDKIKSGGESQLIIGCDPLNPISEGCLHTMQDGCTSNPCTDPNELTGRCLHSHLCISEFPNICEV